LLAGLLALSGLWGAAKDLVLFDTDSGLFGDDGAALVMLLRTPALVSVEAITIVPGNVWARQGAEYMFHILDLLKRPPVTVAVGAASWDDAETVIAVVESDIERSEVAVDPPPPWPPHPTRRARFTIRHRYKDIRMVVSGTLQAGREPIDNTLKEHFTYYELVLI